MDGVSSGILSVVTLLDEWFLCPVSLWMPSSCTRAFQFLNVPAVALHRPPIV